MDDGEILLRVLDGIVISAQETTTKEQIATDVSQQYEVSHQEVQDRLDGDPDQRKPSDPTGTEIVVEYYELEEEVLRVIGIEDVIVSHEVQELPSREDDDDDDQDEDDEELEIHHIDVGQADSTLLITPSNETILIDTGDWPQEGDKVIDYLEKQDIEKIDHLVATHVHADHIGGHAEVIDHFENERNGVGVAYDPGINKDSRAYEDYLDALGEHDITLNELQEGDSLSLLDNEVESTVLNPQEDLAGDHHYDSISITFQYEGMKYLTTGDVEQKAEQRMVEEWGSELESDIYHAGHHASSSSSTDRFLSKVNPRYAIISSGEDNQYGHPHDEVLDRLADHGVETYWTGAHSHVVMKIDSEDITIESTEEFPTDPRDLKQ